MHEKQSRCRISGTHGKAKSVSHYFVRTTIASVLCLVYGKPVMKLMKLTEACNLVDFSHNTAT